MPSVSLRLALRAALAAVLIALVGCPAADAHRGLGRKSGYVSNLAGLEPNVLGVLVAVVGSDYRLRLSNYSRKTVVILGYQREPYLRFDRTGVYVNVHSSATFVNRGPFGRTPAPASVTAGPRPVWRKVARGASCTWHDHRILWASAIPPPAVRRAPNEAHHIFDWQVPGRANGRPFAIVGFLGYVPPPQADNGSAWTMAVTVAGAAGAGLVTGVLLLAHRRRGARRH